MAHCTIRNKTQQRRLSHTGLTEDYGGAASNMQCVHEPTEQMSLVFTANYDVGVVRIAGLESLGPAVRPVSNWALLGPGELYYAHGSLGPLRKAFEIGPLLGMAQSLLTDPECKPAWASIVETVRPCVEGPWSRSSRASARRHPGRGRAASPSLPYVPG